jgi:hypothetical protein
MPRKLLLFGAPLLRGQRGHRHSRSEAHGTNGSATSDAARCVLLSVLTGIPQLIGPIAPTEQSEPDDPVTLAFIVNKELSEALK